MINKKIHNNKKGFSILEILIYLSLFTIISIVVINSFIIVMSTFARIRINHDLLNSGSNVMDRITYEIHQAKNIDIINSSSEVLVLNNLDSLGNITIVKFIKEGESLNLYRNDVLVGNLLNQNISLNLLSFDNIITTNSEGVKIKIVLAYSSKNIDKVESFYNTVILRGAY